MQLVSSRFWIRLTVSISYDDNHYTTGIEIINDYDQTFTRTQKEILALNNP